MFNNNFLLTGDYSFVKRESGGFVMGKKSLTVLMLVVLLLPISLQAQTMTQMGYIVKKGLQNTSVIAVIVNVMEKERLEKEAQSAQLITKLKYIVFTVKNKSEIAAKINEIKNLTGVAVLIVTDEQILTENTVKFIAQKLSAEKTPVITSRPKDTLQGALMAIYMNEGTLEKHLNKISLSALGLTMSEEFIAECVVDVE